MSVKQKMLSEIPVGGTFKVGQFEFIKFADENGVVTAVSRGCLYNSAFGDNNNLANSDIFKKLTDEILPKIEEHIGAENVLEFETDLLSLDGSSKHGSVRSKISIPTLDFYRQNRAIFEKHKPDQWWWLATPDSTSEYTNDNWCVCVAPSGYVYDINCCFNGCGVRPVLNFVSSIFVSCDE